MTVAELSERLGAGEFEKWKKYYSLEPFGQERDNWHMARFASLYMNAHLKKGAKPLSPDDFMYKTIEETEKQKIKKLMSGMGALAARKNKEK